MHHTKLIIFGIILVIVAVFAFAFWDKLYYTQQDIANNMDVTKDLITDQPDSELVVPKNSDQSTNTGPATSSSTEISDIERDLNQTDLSGLDSESSQIEAEASGL